MVPLNLLWQDFCWAPQAEMARRLPAAIAQLVVHRIAVSQEDPAYGDRPADVARFFAAHPAGRAATGGAMPYPILVAADGVVTQTLPLTVVTPHVRAHNPHSLGVGVVGDFRAAPPAPRQHAALVWVLAHLCGALRLGPEAVVGHDGLAGGSHDPDKQCPGAALPLAPLRQAVQRAMAGGGVACDWVW